MRLQKDYQSVRKGLLRLRCPCSCVRMFSRSNFFFLPVILAIGLVSFSQAGLAEEAIAPLASSDVNDDVDGADDNDKEGKSSSARKRTPAFTANGTRLPDSTAPLSAGLVSATSSSTFQTMEPIVVAASMSSRPTIPRFRQWKGPKSTRGRRLRSPGRTRSRRSRIIIIVK